MSQPTRLREGTDPALRELLLYAQTQGRPSPARVEALTARVLAELGQAAAGEPDAPSTESVPSPAAALRLTAWPWLAGLGLALVLGAGAYVLIGAESDGARTRKAAPRPARSERAEPSPPVERTTTAAPPPAPAPAPAQRAPDQGKLATRAEPRVRRAEPAADPAAEVALLQRARRALASEPAEALGLIAEHGRDYPDGMFREEREALAVEALWRAGQGERATRRLAAMLRRYPRSPYRERLSALLVDARQ
jgi:hypothetical protein